MISKAIKIGCREDIAGAFGKKQICHRHFKVRLSLPRDNDLIISE